MPKTSIALRDGIDPSMPLACIHFPKGKESTVCPTHVSGSPRCDRHEFEGTNGV